MQGSKGSKCLANTLTEIEIRNDGQKRCRGKKPARRFLGQSNCPPKEGMRQQANELVLGGVEHQHDMGVDSRCATSGDETLSPKRGQQGSWGVKPPRVNSTSRLVGLAPAFRKTLGYHQHRINSVPLVVDGTVPTIGHHALCISMGRNSSNISRKNLSVGHHQNTPSPVSRVPHALRSFVQLVMRGYTVSSIATLPSSMLNGGSRTDRS